MENVYRMLNQDNLNEFCLIRDIILLSDNLNSITEMDFSVDDLYIKQIY